eukprot:4878344-Amphidinium_carterae.1
MDKGGPIKGVGGGGHLDSQNTESPRVSVSQICHESISYSAANITHSDCHGYVSERHHTQQTLTFTVIIKLVTTLQS